jgi:glycosyltransferase involved in cell wall biosynthesis
LKNCLTKDLPPPLLGRSGWPWTESSPNVPPYAPDGKPWPRVTVITPSFNQGQYIEETIRSVLLQGYPNLEYFVIDGGSSDCTVSIIRKYEPWLTYWESKPDKGQVDALNKGLAIATGEIFNWINSDDYLLPGALHNVAAAFGNADAVAAVCENFGDGLQPYAVCSQQLSSHELIAGDSDVIFHQPALWFKCRYIGDSGGIDKALHNLFDWDLAIRYLDKHPRVHYLDTPIARFRLHPNSKTCSKQPDFHSERLRVLRKLVSHNFTDRSLAKLCKMRVRQYDWWERIEDLFRSNSSGISRAARIILESLKDPSIRWSRLTLGAMRRSLAHQRQ